MSSPHILYLDTSALVKFYVAEPGSDEVRTWVLGAAAVSTSRIAHVEVAAALARRVREQLLTAADAQLVRAALEMDLAGHLLVVDLSGGLAARAAALTDDHPLRGMDAIHLASALWLQLTVLTPVRFAVWDVRLGTAARWAGLDVLGV